MEVVSSSDISTTRFVNSNAINALVNNCAIDVGIKYGDLSQFRWQFKECIMTSKLKGR